MKRISFEKQFPNLKNKFLFLEHDHYEGSSWLSSNEDSFDMALDINEHLFLASDVQKYCLDKQKVREALEKRLEKAKKMSEETDDPRFANFVSELFYDDVKEMGL